MGKIKIPESLIVSSCIQWLWRHGIKARRRNVGGMKKEYQRKDGSRSRSFIRFGKPGEGDIWAIIPPAGRHLEVECKSINGEQTTEQKQFQQEVEEAGGIYILAYSVDDIIARNTEILGSRP